MLLRRGLIPWLAGIDPETGSPRRRIARLTDVPPEAAPLIALLVEQRLLSTDAETTPDGTRETTIEPAHEALLRQWALLQGWLEEDLGALTTLEAVKRAARDWAANAWAPDWLNHACGRLEDAEQIAARPDFAAYLSEDARGYLRHCRKAETVRRREREAAQERAQRQRRRVLQAVAVAAAVFFVAAIVSGWEYFRAESARRAADERLATAQLNESRFLTEKADSALASGDPQLATLIALQALPLNMRAEKRRPLWPQAASILADARNQDRQQDTLHTGPVQSATFSFDGTRILTASSWDNTARLWDAKTGAALATLSGHTGPVNSAAFSSDGTRIVTTSDDNTARPWDGWTGAALATLTGHTGAVNSAAFSSDGTRVVTASSDQTARVWNAETGATLAVRTCSGWPAAFSPDGIRFVTACWDNTARLWDAKTGAALTTLSGHTGPVVSAVFSPDGTRIVTASHDGTARVWNAETGAQLALLQGKAGSLNSAAWSWDGARIVTASDGHVAQVWDVKTGALLATLTGHTDRVFSAAFSPDGTRIVTASGDGTARLWDARTGAQLAPLTDQTGWANSAAFSPDGTRIVIAAADGTARLLDARTGALLATLIGHTDTVVGAAFSRDGARIVTASLDRTARVWDSKTDALLATLAGHTGAVMSAAFSSDGTRIVTASDDHTVRLWAVWPLLTDDTVTYASASAMRALTPPERARVFLELPSPPPPASPAAATSLEQVAAMSVEQLRAAASSGNPYAHRRLAELYERGDGLPQDLEKALFHHAIEARLFAETSEDDEAQIATSRRGSIARALSPEAAVRIAYEAMVWKPTR